MPAHGAPRKRYFRAKTRRAATNLVGKGCRRRARRQARASPLEGRRGRAPGALRPGGDSGARGFCNVGGDAEGPVRVRFGRRRAAVAMPGGHRHGCQIARIRGRVHVPVRRRVVAQVDQVVRMRRTLPGRYQRRLQRLFGGLLGIKRAAAYIVPFALGCPFRRTQVVLGVPH